MKLQQLAAAALAAGTLVGISSQAQAQGQGLVPALRGGYLGGSVGRGEALDACNGFQINNVSCDNKDTAWRLFAGYQFSPNWAAELGYSDLGEANASGPGGIAHATTKQSAFDLVGVGIWPFAQKFSVFGKLGVYYGEVKANASSPFLTGDAKEHSTDLTYGIGAGYDVTRNVGLRVEWQRYNNMGGDSTGGKTDVEMLSVGALYRFQ